MLLVKWGRGCGLIRWSPIFVSFLIVEIKLKQLARAARYNHLLFLANSHSKSLWQPLKGALITTPVCILRAASCKFKCVRIFFIMKKISIISWRILFPFVQEIGSACGSLQVAYSPAPTHMAMRLMQSLSTPSNCIIFSSSCCKSKK